MRRLEGRGGGAEHRDSGCVPEQSAAEPAQDEGGVEQGAGADGRAVGDGDCVRGGAGEGGVRRTGRVQSVHRALLEEMDRPGRRLVDVLGATAGVVERETSGMSEGRQEPWLEMKPLQRPFYFVPPSAAQAAQAPEGAGDLERNSRLLVQQGLALLGFPPGPVDGDFGPKTRSAVTSWQEAKGYEATGSLTAAQAQVLIAVGGRCVRSRVGRRSSRATRSRSGRNCHDARTRTDGDGRRRSGWSGSGLPRRRSARRRKMRVAGRRTHVGGRFGVRERTHARNAAGIPSIHE